MGCTIAAWLVIRASGASCYNPENSDLNVRGLNTGKTICGAVAVSLRGVIVACVLSAAWEYREWVANTRVGSGVPKSGECINHNFEIRVSFEANAAIDEFLQYATVRPHTHGWPV